MEGHHSVGKGLIRSALLRMNIDIDIEIEIDNARTDNGSIMTTIDR